MVEDEKSHLLGRAVDRPSWAVTPDETLRRDRCLVWFWWRRLTDERFRGYGDAGKGLKGTTRSPKTIVRFWACGVPAGKPGRSLGL